MGAEEAEEEAGEIIDPLEAKEAQDEARAGIDPPEESEGAEEAVDETGADICPFGRKRRRLDARRNNCVGSPAAPR